ncbi:MAG TPA: DbpA RNA binding domain-containing protein, partial [Gemmatimonadaceae bacterium]|nr:DbpA RNA binding domain-containing protein [Gemmatimonadaceae bacterium]
FDVPSAAEAYVHRIGRTGRAGRAGVAITFAEPREQRMLRNIELLTKQKIELAPVPTVADLRERRMETARAELRETVAAGGLEAYRAVVESLAPEFDMADIAAAALKRAESQGREREDVEIPASVEHHAVRPAVERSRPSKPGSAKKGRPGELASIYVGGGRKLKIRPGDIVGAIVHEAGLSAESIGAIQVADRHSTVRVPADDADRVIAALGAASIKGKKLVVRRDRA